jgi:hypothetical protein
MSSKRREIKAKALKQQKIAAEKAEELKQKMRFNIGFTLPKK